MKNSQDPSLKKIIKYMIIFIKKTAKRIVTFLSSSKKAILLILFVALATLILSTAISIFLSRFSNLHVPSIGNIQTIGVEAYGGDINLTQDGKQYIDWGLVYPGTLTNRSFYIQSNGNVGIMLNLTATNWSPADISNYLTLSWNYTETPINPNQTIPVTLTLSANSSSLFINYLIENDVKEFSFDIIIRPSHE